MERKSVEGEKRRGRQIKGRRGHDEWERLMDAHEQRPDAQTYSGEFTCTHTHTAHLTPLLALDVGLIGGQVSSLPEAMNSKTH